LEKSSFEEFLSLLEPFVLSAEGLEGINSIQNELNDAVFFKFAGTDNFGTNKESKKGEGFVRNFKSEKGKHVISGLDREIVCARDWAMSVVLVLDGFSLVDRERAPPLLVI
jgi:hypothetical protein